MFNGVCQDLGWLGDVKIDLPADRIVAAMAPTLLVQDRYGNRNVFDLLRDVEVAQ